MWGAIAALLSTQVVSAQNWRQPNPDQPNGYRASEADSHYHGKYHEPAQPLNGYRASEGRSHYGGERMESSSGFHDQDTGGPGSAFRNSSTGESGPGSAFSNASAFRSGGDENSVFNRMQRANRWQSECRNLRSAGYNPSFGPDSAAAQLQSSQQQQYSQTQQTPQYSGSSSRFSTYQPMIQRETELRQNAIQRVESGGGFTRIYAGE